MDTSIRDTIARVAREEGIDPAYALAVAERESSFNPNARASKSIAGLFQMTGGLRRQYGAGDSADPETQTRAFARFTKDLQGEMASHLGRDPTTAETYLGHFWGGPRAARVLAGDHAGLAPSDLFSARELAENPQLARGSSAGGLASTIMADVNRRQAKYGGNGEDSTQKRVDFAQFGQDKPTDFASFGQPQQPVTDTAGLDQAASPEDSGKNLPPVRPGTEIDIAQFGQPQRVAMGYDPISDEMGSGNPAEPTPKDQGLIQPSPGGAGQPMERNPAFVPKAPLQQVPEENLDPNRPDFYQRQLDASAQPPDFSQFGASPQKAAYVPRDHALDIAGIVATVAPPEHDKNLDPGMVIPSEPPPTYFRKGIAIDPDGRHMDSGMPVDEENLLRPPDQQLGA